MFGFIRSVAGGVKVSSGLSSDEQAVILGFARGDERFRREALKIHRKHMKCGDNDNIYQRFMSAVDKVVPDYYAADAYRRQLLSGV